MNALFDYLNNNQGAMITILTFVYVIATLITVRVIHKSNGISKQAIQHSMQVEKEKSRPYIIFDFVADAEVVYAIIQNIGCTPACNVLVNIEDKIKEIRHDKRMTSLANRNIAFVAPGRIIKDFINVSHAIFSVNQDHTYNVEISYCNTSNEKYCERIVVDLEHVRGLGYIIEKDHLKDISREISNINSQITSISKSLNTLTWEFNSFLDKNVDTINIKELDASEFLKYYFKNEHSGNKIISLDLMSHWHTKKSEEIRDKVIACEQLGLLRKERNCYVLTMKGHEIFEDEDASDKDLGSSKLENTKEV